MNHDQTPTSELLVELLDLWRRFPDPDLIHRIDRSLPAEPQPGPEIARQKYVTHASRRGDPLLLGSILATLREVKASAMGILLARLEDAWPDDPRLTDFYLQLLADPPFVGASSKPVWREVFSRMQRTADTRAHRFADLQLGGFTTTMVGYIDKLRTRALTERKDPPSMLPAAERARIEQLLATWSTEEATPSLEVLEAAPRGLKGAAVVVRPRPWRARPLGGDAEVQKARGR